MEQVESLMAYQEYGALRGLHPYTCGNYSGHPKLIATMGGWVCQRCEYRQDWAHDWTANFNWIMDKK